jgi:hypothetical protein
MAVTATMTGRSGTPSTCCCPTWTWCRPCTARLRSRPPLLLSLSISILLVAIRRPQSLLWTTVQQAQCSACTAHRKGDALRRCQTHCCNTNERYGERRGRNQGGEVRLALHAHLQAEHWEILPRESPNLTGTAGLIWTARSPLSFMLSTHEAWWQDDYTVLRGS